MMDYIKIDLEVQGDLLVEFKVCPLYHKDPLTHGWNATCGEYISYDLDSPMEAVLSVIGRRVSGLLEETVGWNRW